MGQLIEGRWSEDRPLTDAKGHFVREPSSFRAQVTTDGSTPFAPESGRYHLYASWACPWAHRVLIVRKLRKLEDVISLSIAKSQFGDEGWVFEDDEPGATVDEVNGFRWLHEAYTSTNPEYTGRVTVPLLWDKATGAAVNNESREIIRMLDTVFLPMGDPTACFRPPGLEDAIDHVIDDIFTPLNNGVYRAGFARSQEAHAQAVTEVFECLDRYEALLDRQRYAAGDVVTEADWCLFTTLIRFEPVYHYHFKCNLRRLRDYPNLWAYTKELYQVPGVAEVCNHEHVKRHYYTSHESINPTLLIPLGPILDLESPHGRDAKRHA